MLGLPTMYRTIDSAFWLDKDTKPLSPQAKLVFLYLITNPHAHVSGIYYLPAVLIPKETGLEKRKADEAMAALWDADLISYDDESEVVWVRNMMRYQGRGEKNERSAARQIESIRAPHIVDSFLSEYPSVKRLVNSNYLHRVSDTLSDTPSIGHPDLALRAGSGSGSETPPTPPKGGAAPPRSRRTNPARNYSDQFNRLWQTLNSQYGAFAPSGDWGSKARAFDEFKKLPIAKNKTEADLVDFLLYIVGKQHAKKLDYQRSGDKVKTFQDLERYIRNRRFED